MSSIRIDGAVKDLLDEVAKDSGKTSVQMVAFMVLSYVADILNDSNNLAKTDLGDLFVRANKFYQDKKFYVKRGDK